MTSLNRDQEKMRYEEVYRDPRYRMGLGRLQWGVECLREMVPAGGTSLLDVGTGRGELIVAACALGLEKAWGVDAAPSLAWGMDNYKVFTADAWDLPFGDGIWDMVSCLDMLEHIQEKDVDKVLKELFRVARHRVILTASNIHSNHVDHGELHITRLSYDDWNTKIRTAALNDVREWRVSRVGKVGVAEGWNAWAL